MEPATESIINTSNGAPSEPPPLTESSSNATIERRREKRMSLPARPNVTAHARHSKRLTLNFPINPPTTLWSEQSSPSTGLITPATASSANPSLGRTASNTPVPIDDSNDGSDLLTAIASQERKVLELREELQRAEAELAELKKQWASSEKARKRTELSYHAEALKSLKSPAPGSDPSKSSEKRNSGVDPSTQARISRELERRNSFRTTQNGDISISANGRRVFPSSKHTRTLSLLSPDRDAGFKHSFPQKGDKAENERQATRHPRSATLPSVERSDPAKTSSEQPAREDTLAQWRRSLPPSSRETLLRTGRQMASDLKEGFWTFLEDIRQATVGEEGISATSSRTIQPTSTTSQRSSGRRSDRSVTPSRSRERSGADIGRTNSTSSGFKERAGATKRSGKNTTPVDIGMSFWSEFGVDAPGQTSKTTKAADSTQNGRKESEDANLLDVDDNWDAWDTPQPTKTHTPSSSRSTIESKHDQSPSTQLSSPRTSASFGERNSTRKDSVVDTGCADGIPWPALSKFTPSKLTRTASNLMAEWERSLTSSPKQDQKENHPLRGEETDEDDWGPPF
ncbi:hypothetical protein VTN77DRAFT_3878 [Rasamsonia byssochlamydoides]|uniref:uncharacterized protein n=1 Tax=Rasamsonia byssochlamydoides TaxID=89139 RepID=UPI003743F249